MDFHHLVAGDHELLAEILDRQSDLAALAGGSLESLDAAGGTEALSAGLARMREGSYVPGANHGVEAIIERFTRPVFLVQDMLVTPPADARVAMASGGESEVISGRLADAGAHFDTTIPSVGRINLANHRFTWVGTGWMVEAELAVTNRHVAEHFGERQGDSFGFRAAEGGRVVKASIDWRREYSRPDESVVRIEEVLWIEPDGRPDLAIVRVRTTDENGRPTPPPIPLMHQADVEASVGNWVAVIGYPARSPYNDLADQQRIFDGIYDVKRVAPGTVTAVTPDGQLHHDATTLGGNSGSVVMDLATGQAVGLHFGGFEGDRNMAVQAPVVAARMAEHT
jgi:hypothetical protein